MTWDRLFPPARHPEDEPDERRVREMTDRHELDGELERRLFGRAVRPSRSGECGYCHADAGTFVCAYSASIAGAWRVVEEMERRFGFNGFNGFTLMRKDADQWYCEFPQPNWESGEGATPAEAICRAARAALGPADGE